MPQELKIKQEKQISKFLEILWDKIFFLYYISITMNENNLDRLSHKTMIKKIAFLDPKWQVIYRYIYTYMSINFNFLKKKP